MSIFLSSFFVWTLAPSLVGVPITLTREGQPEAHLRIAASASDATRGAAEELAAYVERISGARLPIRTGPGPGVEILVGTLAEWPEHPLGRKVAALGPEGFVIETAPSRLSLLAGDELGVRHAAVALLEHFGCRWFYPGEIWEHIPHRPTLTVADLSLAERPTMGYRWIWYGWGAATPRLQEDYQNWLRHNRQGGHLSGDVGHAYEAVARPDLHFADHPQWFPLIEGERVPRGQLCASNPEIIRRAIDYARDYFQRHPAAQMVSLSPNDGGGYCECANCQAQGTISDRTLHFANRVAEALEKEFPDRWIAFYAYYLNSAPPHIEGHPNVIVYIATSFITSGHTVDELIEGWSAKVHHLGIRDYYCVDLWSRDMPRYLVGHYAERIPYYVRHKVRGISAESSCCWGAEGLNYYLASRLQWNADAEVEEILRDYYENCWGPAAPAMRRWFALWEQGSINRRRYALAAYLLAEALEASPGDETVLRRLREFCKYLHWVRLYRDYARAEADEAEELGRRLVQWTFGITDSGMVHSYSMFRDPRIFGGWLQTWARENPEKWRELWEGRREVGGEAAEAAFRRDLATLKPPLGVEDTAYGGPLQTLGAGAVRAPNTGEPHPLYRGRNCFWLRAEGPGPYPLIVTAGEIVADQATQVDLYLVESGTAARAESPRLPMSTATVEPGEPQTVVLPLEPGQVYRLEVKPEGGSAARLDFGNLAHGWILTPEESAHVIGGSGGDWAVFVPRGVKSWALGLRTSDGYGRVTIKDPTGQVVLQEAGNFATSEEFAVPVPPGQDGRAWYFAIDQCEDAESLYLRGIPGAAAQAPELWLGPGKAR